MATVAITSLFAAACTSSSGESAPTTTSPRSTTSTTAGNLEPPPEDLLGASLADVAVDDLAPFSPLTAIGGNLVAYRTVHDEVLHTVAVDVVERELRWSTAEPVDRIRGVPMVPVTYLPSADVVVTLSALVPAASSRAARSRAARGSAAPAQVDLLILAHEPATGAVVWSRPVDARPSDFPAACDDGASACLNVERSDGTTDLLVFDGTDGTPSTRRGGFERIIVGPADADGGGLELSINGMEQPYEIALTDDLRQTPVWASDLFELRGDLPAHPDGGWFAIVDGGTIQALWLGPQDVDFEPLDGFYGGAVIGLDPSGTTTYLLDDTTPCYDLSDAQTFALCELGIAEDETLEYRSITMFDPATGELGDTVALTPPIGPDDGAARIARIAGRQWLLDTGSGWVRMDLDARTLTPADPADHPLGWCDRNAAADPVEFETVEVGVVAHTPGQVLEPCRVGTGAALPAATVVGALADGTLVADGLGGSVVTVDAGPVWVSDGTVTTG